MNIVLGVYNGYNSLKTSNERLYYFVKSLRKYNSECKIVIICESHNIFQDLVDFCIEMDCELYTNFILEYNMMFYRFKIYRDYLQMKDKCSNIDKILLSDLNDVIFQEDPFKIEFSEDVYCALEGNLLNDINNSSSRLNMDWIRDCSRSIDISNINFDNKFVICAGTILGTYLGIMKYLDFYVKTQSYKLVNDQGLLNVYIYKYSDSHETLEYRISKILTLDRIDFDSLNTSSDRSIINDNGEKYSILHQINRCNLPYMLSLV